MPWIRNLYIVTDQQTPPNLAELGPIKVIDHREIIPNEFLPTFNSNVIAMFLKNIKGLSDTFLYLNDDVFVGKPTEPSYFFDRNGSFKVRLTNTRIPSPRNGSQHILHKARANTVRVASDHGLITSDRSLYHGPHPMRKDLLEEIHKEFENEIRDFCKNKFRSENDLIIEWLQFFYGFKKGCATWEGASDYLYLNVNSSGTDGGLQRIMRKTLPRIFTLNQAAEIPPRFLLTDSELRAKFDSVWERLNK
jgi:hypothetical protein